MLGEPSEAVVSAWVGLLRAQRRALGLVEERLKAAGLPPLAWYDALLELERAGAAGMRPFEALGVPAAVVDVRTVRPGTTTQHRTNGVGVSTSYARGRRSPGSALGPLDERRRTT